MAAEQTQGVSREWVKARERSKRNDACDSLRAVAHVRQVADALNRVGLPEPDSAHIYSWGGYVVYLAQGDEPKWRDLCHRARMIETERRAATTFEQPIGTDTQVAITEVHLPETWSATQMMLKVKVHVGLRSTCHVEYETKTVKVPIVVCND